MTEETEVQTKPIVFIKYPMDFEETKRIMIYNLISTITNNLYDIFLGENIDNTYVVKILNIEITPEIENHKEIILNNLKSIA